jgi:ABC-2 type transport system permease protein
MSTTLVLAGTEARLFLREWGMLVFAFVFPPLMMLILAGVFGSDADPEAFGPMSGTDFYIASYLGIPLASVALTGLPVMLASYRELGVLKRFEASGISAVRVVSAQALVSLGSVVAGAALVLATAAPTYGLPEVHNLPGVLAVLGAGSGALLTIGIALGLVLPTVRSANAVGMLLFLPMFILGGGGPPPGVMTPTMRDIAELLPVTHVTEGLRKAWLYEGSWAHEVWWLLAWWLFAAVLVAVLSHRRVTRRA